MKAKKMWLLVPFICLFAAFYLGLEVIPFGPHPFMYWWDIPVMMSIIVVTVVPSVIAIGKAV
jgi:hypothetical protein